MSAEHLRVRSGDVLLAVRAWGPLLAPPVVLVHGFPDTSAVWEPVAERLAANHRVIAYDVRGAGASSAPARTADYSLAQLSADLAAVIDATAARPVHLVGHDWGSIAAWEAVTDERMRARLASFTSIAGPCLDHVGHWLRDRPARDVAAQALRSWYIAAFHAPGAGLVARALGQRGVQLYRANVAARLAQPRARTTELPVQVVVPTRDPFVHPQLTHGVERWAPNAVRREVVAGHWVQRTHPDLVARMIASWVRGPRPSAPARAATGPLAGQLAVVTGAGSGIGRALAFELIERGAAVIAADLDEAAARTTAELGALLGGTIHAYRVDVADAAQFDNLTDRIQRVHGVPDIVVNNAGIAVAGGFLATTPREWERVLAVNLGGVVHGCRAFARQMLDEGRAGHIVNVASAAAFAPSRTFPAYATSKAAVVMLTECLRAELAGSGIRVSAVCPGFADTGIATATRYAGDDDARQATRRRATDRLYRRRAMSAERVARAIADAITSGEPLALVGAEATAAHWIARAAPGLGRRLARIDFAPRGGSR